MTFERPAMPQLPKLQDGTPFAAWLSRHLLKVTIVVMILLGFALLAIVRGYGFEISKEGIHRTQTAHGQGVTLSTPFDG